MNHFTEQNGPFRDVKRPILKNQSEFPPLLFGLFTIPSAFCLKKRAKNFAEFFGIFY
jgi:hypothetical protein